MACRNLEKGQAAVNDILGVIPEANLKLMALDLADLELVKTFAATFRSEPINWISCSTTPG